VLGSFDRLGSVDSGKSFEVLAIVDAAVELGEGTILEQRPPRLVSHAITVTRK
jgi:hypothetical protein